MSRALERLRSESAARQRRHQFFVLERFLDRDPEPGDYRKVAADLGLTTRGVKVAVHRLRCRYRQLQTFEDYELIDCVDRKGSAFATSASPSRSARPRHRPF